MVKLRAFKITPGEPRDPAIVVAPSMEEAVRRWRYCETIDDREIGYFLGGDDQIVDDPVAVELVGDRVIPPTDEDGA